MLIANFSGRVIDVKHFLTSCFCELKIKKRYFKYVSLIIKTIVYFLPSPMLLLPHVDDIRAPARVDQINKIIEGLA